MSDSPTVWTDFGWAHASLTPPRDKDMHWIKMPEQHIYTWDGDAWYRIKPPEFQKIEERDLPHG
jgi:hypothetical protein